jgi:hypothetical protein
MAKIANKNGLNFILNAGDNFYFNGVNDVFDHRFEVFSFLFNILFNFNAPLLIIDFIRKYLYAKVSSSAVVYNCRES